MALSAVMLCVSIPMTAFTAHAESDSNHVHDESCYRKKLHCLHEHDDSCYEGDETATSSNMKKLVCDHEHGEGCYEAVLDCGYRQEENSSEGAEGDGNAGADKNGGLASVASPAAAARALTLTGVERLVADINTWAAGNGIVAEVDEYSGDVIVTGKTTTEASDKLELEIPENVTVEWRAVLTSSAEPVIGIVEESGTDSVFSVTDGEIISTSNKNHTGSSYNTIDNAAIYNAAANTSILVSGGSIRGGGGDRSTGIYNFGEGLVSIQGGRISGGTGTKNYGIFNSFSGITEVSEGIVGGGGGEESYGIQGSGEIRVSGGSISGGTGSGENVGIVFKNSTNSVISGGNISGGYGANTCGILNDSPNSLLVSGGTIDGGKGTSISVGIVNEENSSITVKGGSINADGKKKVCIMNEGGTVVVSGSKIVNTGGYAMIDNSSSSGIQIGGSAVIFGKDLDSTGGAIKTAGTQPVPGGTAAIITWAGDKTTYLKGSAADLDVSPAAVKAEWSTQNGQGGVFYDVSGINNGFITLPGVTVKAAPAIITETLPDGTIGVAYSQTLAADGSAGATWSLESGGSLPVGLSLDGSGKISGIPTKEGTSHFTVRASNDIGSDTKAMSITIAAGLSSIAVTTGPAKTTYTAGQSFDSSGMVVTAAYSDGSTRAVTGYTVTPSGALTEADSRVTVTYTEGGIAKTATLAITVKAAGTNHTIIYDANGGSVIPATGITDTDGRLGSLPTPVRGGSYQFDGWFTAASGGIKITTTIVFTENCTIYAHWTYIGGGSGSGGGSGGGGGSGSGHGFAGGNSSPKESLPKNYTGGTKNIDGVIVPSYVEKVVWVMTDDGRWRLRRADGSDYVNTWVAAYNPYADLSAGQQAFDWFMFDVDGYMVTGWYTDSQGGSYYLNPVSDNTKGRMMTGWVLIDGSYYYFNEEPDGTRGRLFRNTKAPDGRYVDENGVWDGKEK